MPGRIAVDPPRYWLAGRPGAGRDVVSDHHATRGEDPVVSRGQVTDQDVEVNP